MQVDEALRSEITPKNILMIGPTGVGKTEIARRLAKLANAPFVKVEATKFTEVGYVGREVDSIIKDLRRRRGQDDARAGSGQGAASCDGRGRGSRARRAAAAAAHGRLRARAGRRARGRHAPAFPQDAREGQLDDREIEIEVRALPVGVEIMAPPGMEELSQQLQSMFQNIGGNRTRPRRLKVAEAFKLLTEEEAAKLINEDELKVQALRNAEQNGIVFIDEIDKIARRQETMGADVSREGVQRDLLPLVEGCTVTTKYGIVQHRPRAVHRLGRIPHVEAVRPDTGAAGTSADPGRARGARRRGLRADPDRARCVALHAVPRAHGNRGSRHHVHARRVCAASPRSRFDVNQRTENIGARRLHTVMERLLESVSFDASERSGVTVQVDADYVQSTLGELAKDQDLARYVL